MASMESEVATEDVSRTIARVAWGLLLIWTGADALLGWGWGIGFIGAGVVLLGAQAVRRQRRLPLDGFALVAGALFVICGVGSLAGIAIDVFPVLCILAGAALVGSAWTARARHQPGGHGELHATPHPRA